MFKTELLVAAKLVLAVATLNGRGALQGQAQRQPNPKAPAQLIDKRLVDRYGDPLPAGAIMRLGTVRFRFRCYGLSFLPDGETVVSADNGGAIQFWEARPGRLIREIDPGLFTIGNNAGFSLSRDGRRLALNGSLNPATGWRANIRVFDLVSGNVVRTFEEAPKTSFNALALTPDGKMLLMLDREGNLRIQELATGAELLRYKFPGDVMAHLALSSDGSTLALASGPNSRKIYVWKWQTAEDPREFNSGDYRARTVAFSPDDKLLAACDDSDVSVHVWEVQSGRLLHKLDLPDREPYRHISVAFSPDGKTLAASGRTNDRTAVHLWDPLSGEFLQRLKLSGVPLAFSPNGTLLACGSQVWDFSARKELSANDEAHLRAVEHIRTGDHGLIATSGDGKTIRIWEAATGRQQRRITQDGWIRDIALSPDGSKLVSNSLQDDAVCLWEVATGRQIFKLPGHGRLGGRRALAFTLDGKSFLSWGDDMFLRKWDVRTGKAIFEHAIRPTGIRVFSEDDEPTERDRAMMLRDRVDAGLFSPGGKELVVKAGNKVFVFDTESGKEVRSFPFDSGVSIAQAISPDGKWLLTSAWAKAEQIKLPDGTVQISTPMNHPVTLSELATGAVRKQLTLPEQGAGPVAISVDGKWFAAASDRPGHHIRVWDLSGQEVWTAENFPGRVRSLAFMPDGKRLISGMEDSSVLIWDFTRKR